MKKQTILALAVIALAAVGCGKRVEYRSGPQGAPGATGAAGTNGERGTDGADAPACSVSPVDPSTQYPAGGAVIQCGSSTVVVKNGVDGAQGAAGQTGADAILEVINPCGVQGAHDEVLLRLSNGSILASFSDLASGQNTRFAIIGPGSYVSTDGTSCHFTVTSDLQVTF